MKKHTRKYTCRVEMFCYRSSSLTVIHFFICARRWIQKFHCFPTMWMCVKLLQLCPTLCDPIDCSPQAPLSMRFSRQEHWSGFLCPPPGDLPDPETEPVPLLSPALADRFFTTSATWEAPTMWMNNATKWSHTQIQETLITCVFHSKFNSKDANQASLDNL